MHVEMHSIPYLKHVIWTLNFLQNSLEHMIHTNLLVNTHIASIKSFVDETSWRQVLISKGLLFWLFLFIVHLERSGKDISLHVNGTKNS